MPAGQREGGERPPRWKGEDKGPEPLALLVTPSDLSLVPQRAVVEQAARSPSPPDLCMQHLQEIQASHEVRPLGALSPNSQQPQQWGLPPVRLLCRPQNFCLWPPA